MDTPTTPRHPSNGYEIINGTPVISGLSSAVASPLVKVGGATSSQTQCAYSPYASPSIRSDGRRRSMRLEMRSPAKNLDLKLGSVDEDVEADYVQASAVELDYCLDDTQLDVKKSAKRRRSLGLQAKQPTPTKSESPEVVKVEKSSTKKSNKKRRQSAHFGVARSVERKAIVTEIARDTETDCVELMPSGLNETKPASKKKRRQSNCFGSAKSVDIELAAMTELEATLSICLTREAEAELVLALDSIASSVLTTILEEHEAELARKDKLDESTDSLDNISFELDEKENRPTISAIKRKKGRRDTFDLSKKRGLRVGPSVLDAPTPGSNTKTVDVHKFEKAKHTGISIDTSIEEESDELKKKLFITPKNIDVNHDVTTELARTLKDDPLNHVVVAVNPEVKATMEELESVAVEERMKTMFGEFKIYNYPCVSARIFSAMSLILTNNEEFSALLPLLTSLVTAEIVSLQNRDENRDVYFINKRVCFSGYDYSSTMPAVDSIDGSHVDLVSSIEALKNVLQEAQKLSPPARVLESAIRCLDDMGSCDNVSEVCAKTLVGYFPSSRFHKAIKHYSNELEDIRCYLTGQESTTAEHIGVRFRLNDFVGRSIRYHLRKLLNSLPESLIDFFVEECEERWGRAVDDRSISSILNCSLEKVNQFMLSSPKLFDDHEILPTFFSKDASELALACGKIQDVRVRASLKSIGDDALKDIASDLQAARTFLLGARACKFVWELLDWPGVKEHVKSKGGFESIESISKVFYDLHLYTNSDHQHFILLRNVDDLTQMLAKVVERLEDTIDSCETAIRKLGRQMISRQKDHAYKTKGTAMYALRMSLEAEKGEKFPLPIANYSC
ncbi:hypothetical protein ACHAXN_008990 [Cyclotella atomus]